MYPRFIEERLELYDDIQFCGTSIRELFDAKVSQFPADEENSMMQLMQTWESILGARVMAMEERELTKRNPTKPITAMVEVLRPGWLAMEFFEAEKDLRVDYQVMLQGLVGDNDWKELLLR